MTFSQWEREARGPARGWRPPIGCPAQRSAANGARRGPGHRRRPVNQTPSLTLAVLQATNCRRPSPRSGKGTLSACDCDGPPFARASHSSAAGILRRGSRLSPGGEGRRQKRTPSPPPPRSRAGLRSRALSTESVARGLARRRRPEGSARAPVAVRSPARQARAGADADPGRAASCSRSTCREVAIAAAAGPEGEVALGALLGAGGWD